MINRLTHLLRAETVPPWNGFPFLVQDYVTEEDVSLAFSVCKCLVFCSLNAIN